MDPRPQRAIVAAASGTLVARAGIVVRHFAKARTANGATSVSYPSGNAQDAKWRTVAAQCVRFGGPVAVARSERRVALF